MTVRQFWAAWAVAAVLMVLALMMRPLEPLPTLVAQRRAAPLPPLPRPPPLADRRTEVEQLATSPMWGPLAAKAPAAGASAPAEAPKWFISGVYRVGDQWRLVLHYERLAKPSAQLGVGDKLPDGSIVETIAADKVRLRVPRQPGAGGPRFTHVWLAVNRGVALPDN
jgi:hypothetical protein